MIDFHVHGMPWQMLPDEFFVARAEALRATGRTRETDLGRLVEKMKCNVDDPDLVRLEADLRASEIDHAVLLGIDWGLLGDGTSGMHPTEQLAFGCRAVQDSAGFFSFVPAVDPRRADAVEVVADALARPEVVGIKLYPPMGFSPADPVCDPVYRLVAEAGAFLMVHTGRQSYPFQLEYGRLEPYGEVQRRWPGLHLVLGHAGAHLWGAEAIEIAKGHPTTYLEVSGWHQLIPDREEELRRFLGVAWAELGPRRVLFGSDHLSGGRSSARVPAIRRWWDIFRSTAEDAGISLADVDDAAGALLRYDERGGRGAR
jgi:hypothetical protein